MMEHTKLPLTKWFLALYLISQAKTGLSALALNDQGDSLGLKLNLVAGFTNEAIGVWAEARLLPQCTVLSDGLGCFAAVTDACCVHTPRVVGALKPGDLPEFKWINTILGNLKTALAAAFHALKLCEYTQQYLSAFVYGFKRRFDLCDLVAQVIVNVSRCQPVTQKHVRGNAETTC